MWNAHGTMLTVIPVTLPAPLSICCVFHLLLQLSLWTRRAEASGFNLLPVPTWEDLEQNPFSKPQNIPLLFNFEKLHGKWSVLCMLVLAVQCASICMRELPVWWWCAHVQELPVLLVRCLLFTCARTAYLVEVFIECTRTYEASFLLINNVVYMSVFVLLPVLLCGCSLFILRNGCWL